MTARRLLPNLGAFVGVVAAYFAAGKFGLALAFVHASSSAVWPPTGIALAALLLLGPRFWPAIWVGAYLVNITTAGSAWTSIGIATGNTLEALIGASLVRRFANGPRAFERPEGVFRWILFAGTISTLVSATIGSTSLCLTGWASWHDYGPVWLTWWLGDAAGALIVAPVLLLWATNPRWHWNRRQSIEAALLLAAVGLVGLVMFGSRLIDRSAPHAFLLIPLLMWGAARFGQREAATATLLLSGLAIFGTLRGFGPFVRASPNDSLLQLQVFMCVIAMMAMTLAAALSERQRFETQLLHLADHDSLTDLLSRRRFQEELGRHLAEARRYGTRGSLLFLDVDDFKGVNDTHGHGVGDRLLVQLGSLLRGRLRDSDLLGRLGGDEFGALLPHTGRDQAQVLAGQVLHAIRSAPFLADGRPLPITASIGIALFPEHGTAIDEVVARADAAMYRAKAAGRNCFRVHAPDTESDPDHSEICGVDSIVRALENGGLLLHAQPILDLRRGRISQYELLLRMTGAGGELVLPPRFLRVAERSGLLPAIDRWVVGQAIALLACQPTGRRGVGLSVNLSPKAFADSELVALVRRRLAETSANPAGLVLEISEVTALTDTERAERFAAGLKALGCRITLDDFGAGSASLHHLKRLPVDYLKIDGGFVRGFPRDRVNQHLVKAIVEMARALRKKTVAGHVEDEETLRRLRESGVDYAQGYHVGRPAAAEGIWSRPRPS